MRLLLVTMGILVAAQGACCAQPQQPIPAGQLVREVVYNELHDQGQHGYWRYWIERHTRKGTRLEEEIETAEGPITRLDQSNGRPLDAAAHLEEQNRLNELLNSPQEQARHRQEYADDEELIGRVVALLPDAFLYEYTGEENGCYRLRFRPNPGYPARSTEARILHAMSGELWVSIRYKRLALLNGRLDENVDFGFGVLGRLYKGGWFRLQRTPVSTADWKIERLEVHMSGRAMLFKTIARETSEVRGGFAPVPAAMSLAQAVSLFDQARASSALISPAISAMSRSSSR
jgi:hypothetical protein